MAKSLRVWRAEHLLSTRKLAAEAGVSNKTIVQIENGRQTPTFATIEKITSVLRVEPSEVAEFALALAERARESPDTTSMEESIPEPAIRVLCVSGVAAFLTVARRLLQTERYAVMTAIGMSLTADQVACLQPALVILDLGGESQSAMTLLQQLPNNPSPVQVSIVVTGRDRRRLEEIVEELRDDAGRYVSIAPYDRDLRGLLATVDSLANTHANVNAD